MCIFPIIKALSSRHNLRRDLTFQMNISKPSQTSNPEKNQKENVNPSILPSSVAQFNDNSSGLEPQGIFVYGTLMAAEFLSWLLTGSSENYKAIISLRQSATLMHYRRVAVNHGDYPALIPGDMSDKVDGFLIVPTSKSQWKKIDDFEGESYRRHCVHVHLQEEDRTVPAHVYIWQGNMDMLLPYKEWSSSYFREERLQDWLGLFDGMEMLGEGQYLLLSFNKIAPLFPLVSRISNTPIFLG